MKMRNKILGILITLVIMIGLMASQVNAADMSASATEVNVGDTVTVTVKLDKPSQSIGLDLTYNADNFKYESVTSDMGGLTENKTQAGIVKVAGSNATVAATYLTFTFTATANTDVDGEDFVGSRFFTYDGEALNTDTVTVAVVEKAEEPTPEEPTDPENPGDVTTPDTDTPADTTVDEGNGETTTNDEQKVDEDGNVITRLPQTGITVFQIAGVVAVVVIAGALAVRKLRK